MGGSNATMVSETETASTQCLLSWRLVPNGEDRQGNKTTPILKLGIARYLDCCLPLSISPAATLPQGLS